jgi:CheY-like chemotaxis protein
VLLVEDDAAVRQITAALLAADGAGVTAVEDGVAALGLLRSAEPFDLLLSDVALPRQLSGLDVVRAARALRPRLPALLASGYVAAEAEMVGGWPERVLLLRKPYRHAELLAAIAATLRPTSGQAALAGAES